MVKKSHANGKAVFHLLKNAGLRSIGNTRIDFQTAIHGTGMQHKRIRTRESEPLGCKLKLQNVFFGREHRFVKAFGLHAKDDDYVGAIERFIDPRSTAE